MQAGGRQQSTCVGCHHITCPCLTCWLLFFVFPTNNFKVNGDPGSTCFEPQLLDGHPHSFWALIDCLCFSWHIFYLQSKNNAAIMVAWLHCQWQFSTLTLVHFYAPTTKTVTAPHGNGHFLLFCYQNKRCCNFSCQCCSVNDTKATHHATSAMANAKHHTGWLFFVLLMTLWQ